MWGNHHWGSMAWEARGLDACEPYNETENPSPTTRVWVVKTSIIGKNCLAQWGRKFTISFGSLMCLGQRFLTQPPRKPNGGGSHIFLSQIPTPFSNFSFLWEDWDNVNAAIKWQALSGLYWICGRTAYTVLPSGWSGSCVLGTLHLSFFLIPPARGEHLGVQAYGDRETQRKRRVLQIGNWKDDEWPPEHIIQSVALPPGQTMGPGAAAFPFTC